jgi:hypothetical protein
MPDEPLDDDLVAAILVNLKDKPSAHLQEMVAAPGGGHWSPEAVHAAGLLLDRRSRGEADEPVVRTARSDPAGGDRPVHLVLAPRFCVPAGFAWLAWLGRVFGRRGFESNSRLRCHLPLYAV